MIAGVEDVGAGKNDYRNRAGLTDPAALTGDRIKGLTGKRKTQLGIFEARTRQGRRMYLTNGTENRRVIRLPSKRERK